MHTEKRETLDPDTPTFNEAMHNSGSLLYKKSMKKDVLQLIKQNTWKIIPRYEVPPRRNNLKSTWYF